jgi:Big-like domain-containing protein
VDPLKVLDSLEIVNFELVTPPPSAAVFQVFKGGGFWYTPLPDFIGTAQFTYRARDPQGAESNEATVTITVGP